MIHLLRNLHLFGNRLKGSWCEKWQLTILPFSEQYSPVCFWSHSTVLFVELAAFVDFVVALKCMR
jgi:hypothetical protein